MSKPVPATAHKNSLKRKVLLLRPSSFDLDSYEQRKVFDRFYRDWRSINTELARIRELFIVETERERAFYPPIEIRVERHPFMDGSLEKAVEKFGGPMVRIVIDPAPGEMGNSADIELQSRSHLVRLRGDMEEQIGWFNATPPFSVKVVSQSELLRAAIIDVALDIMLFYSFPPAGDAYATTTDERKAFSRAKAEFALEQGFESFYGPMWDHNVGYFSLAAAVRSSDKWTGNDAKRLVTVWRQFLETKIYPGATRYDSDWDYSSDIAGYILRAHHRGGQISQRRLRREIERLSPGPYTLVMYSRRPKKQKKLRQLQWIFEKRKLRMNTWFIREHKECVSLADYQPYITFFQFTK